MASNSSRAKYKELQQASKTLKAVEVAEKASGANVTSKYDDLYTYKYNGYDNPGPLNEVRGQPNKNFYGGRYDVEVLKEPKVYYRGGDSTSPLGQWFTETPPSSVADVRINSAVKPHLNKVNYL